MKRAGIPHKGGSHGSKHSCKGAFDQQLNNLHNLDEALLRCLNGLIPDIISNTTGNGTGGSPKALFGNAHALCDARSLAPGLAYSESTSTNPADAV